MRALLHPPRTGMALFKILPEGILCQLINDTILVSPVPTTTHQQVLANVGMAIDEKVSDNDLGEVYFGPLDVYLNDKNVFQPDILFVSKKRMKIIRSKGIFGTPDLIIEVLSDFNETYDRGAKKDVYEEAGVKELWLIDPKTKRCEGFFIQNGRFETIEPTSSQFHIHLLDLTFTF